MMSYPYLKAITVSGFKSIRDATVELGDINVLIGANGAGKSNLLQLFLFLRRLAEGNLFLLEEVIVMEREGSATVSERLDTKRVGEWLDHSVR
jgi:predicted ATPase